MTFLQIIDFHTDRVGEFLTLEEEWTHATEGQRTAVGSQLFSDRDQPGHYVALGWFTDHTSAMANSALPATSDFAERATALSTGPVTFHNLEPVQPPWTQGADDLRHTLETSTPVAHAFADDVELDMIVPHGRVVAHGQDQIAEGLRGEAATRTIELWEVRPTYDGFAVEYAYRCHGEVESLAVGAVIATVREGRIARLFVTCGGNWDAATQQQVRATTGELGSRLVGSAS